MSGFTENAYCFQLPFLFAVFLEQNSLFATKGSHTHTDENGFHQRITWIVILILRLSHRLTHFTRECQKDRKQTLYIRTSGYQVVLQGCVYFKSEV